MPTRLANKVHDPLALLLCIASLVALAACRPTPAPRNGDYLFVWTGDSAGQASDFLAVIDANPASAK